MAVVTRSRIIIGILVAVGFALAAGGVGSSASVSARVGPRRVAPVIVEHGSRRHRWVALTFDADMTYGMLRALRDGQVRSWVNRGLFRELRAAHAPATIFLTGLWTRTYPNVVRELARDPLFELENHSYDHAAWESPCYGLPTVSTRTAKIAEVLKTQRVVAGITGHAPHLFRFPGICHTQADVRLVAGLGLRPVDGDVISGDAFNSDTSAIVSEVLDHVRPGSIVIAHCIGAPNAPATTAAMRQIIPGLRARGYRLVTLARLLAG